MNHIEVTVECADERRREILLAELADFPFESFCEEADCLKAYIREADYRRTVARIDGYLKETGYRYRSETIEDGTERVVGIELRTDRHRGQVPHSRAVPSEKPGCRIRAGHHAENGFRYRSPCNDLPDGGRNHRLPVRRTAGSGHGKRNRRAGHAGRTSRRRADGCGRHRRLGLPQCERKHS